MDNHQKSQKNEIPESWLFQPLLHFKMASSVTSTLIRASVQGIVYLIDSAKGHVYTYNPDRPVFVGTLEKIPEEDKNSISKTNGCLAAARVRYREDIRDVMAAERSRKVEA